MFDQSRFRGLCSFSSLRARLTFDKDIDNGMNAIAILKGFIIRVIFENLLFMAPYDWED